MKRKKEILRTVAVFLLLNFVTQLVLPTAVWALTSGPTAPEFSSFEPIDTTDMVNLSTGDLTYNIPLLEIPGPEGGYPMALSYHAGISPEAEASWVGLGWSLNPGAINRSVNGFADDFTNINQSVLDYWDGGSTEIFGVGLGFAGVVGVGVEWGYDTYKGFGSGYNMMVGYSELGSGLGITAGTRAFGDSYISVGVNSGGMIGQSQASVGLLFGESGTDIYGSAGINVGVLGASISSGSSSPNYRIGGASMNMFNNNSGKISSNGSSYSVTIPLPYDITLDLSYSYTRYYSKTSYNSLMCGSLYFQDATNPVSQTTDSYVLNDLENENNTIISPEKGMGASFPSFDTYQVSAQGIGGSIEPAILNKQYLFRNNNENAKFQVPQTPLYTKTQFRFLNEFSGNFGYETNENVDVANQNTLLNKYNETKTADSRTFNLKSNRLGSSKHVEWFTNGQINSGDAYKDFGLIPAASQEDGGFTAHKVTFDDANGTKFQLHNQIGGFMITNESGVTYHYSQPVYAYNETSYSSSYDAKNVLSTHTYKNIQPYAYTWLLTAITGPDYIDRGAIGLDDSDWGYWVRFDHGKWLNDYKWRNPITDTQKDIDKIVDTYSYGQKEIYYLDAISTRSHVAVFVKDVRTDGKDLSNNITGKLVDSKKVSTPNLDNNPFVNYYETGDENLYYHPHSQLKLTNIFLFKKDKFKTNIASLRKVDNLNYDKTFSYTMNYKIMGYSNSITETSSIKHLSKNVIDINDIDINSFTLNSIKTIDFSHDNSLCPGTLNSIANELIYQKIPVAVNFLGKLTLKSIVTKGIGGTKIIPPTTFDYNENPSYDKNTKDVWGYYRNCDGVVGCDYTNLPNDNLARIERSEFSVKESFQKAHAWSLTDIKTPLGAEIQIGYEPDDYNNIAVNDNTLIRVKSVPNTIIENIKLEIHDSNFKNHLHVGDELNVKILRYYYKCEDELYLWGGSKGEQIVKERGFEIVDLIKNGAKPIITAINNNFIEVNVKYNDFFDTGHKGEPSVYEWEKLSLKMPVAGFIQLPQKTSGYLHYGGGIRVKNIAINNKIGGNSSTEYSYYNGGTSFEPCGLDVGVLPDGYHYNFFDFDENQQLHDDLYASEAKHQLSKIALTFGFNEILANSRELPGPNVFYQKVQVKESVNGQLKPEYKEYEFATPKLNKEDFKNDLDRLVLESSPDYKVVRYNNYGNRPGSLISMTLFRKENEPILKTTNNYLYQSANVTRNDDYIKAIESKFKNQGVIQQRFYENRNNKLIISERVDYPNILIGSKTENIKTGITTETKNIGFDFITGNANKVQSTDAYGNTFLTVSKAAYEEYSGMGLKIHNIANKNMLTQGLSNFVFKTNGTAWDYTKPELENLSTIVSGLVSATYQSWTNLPANLPVNSIGIVSISNYYNDAINNVYKKQSSYTWTGIGHRTLKTDGTSDDKLNPYLINPTTSASTNSSNAWQKTGEVTLYDGFSHALEAKDINNRYACTKMDPDSKKIILSATNATYNGAAYSGAEFNTIESGINKNDGIISAAYSHTGKYALETGANKKGFSYSLNIPANKAYKASVWTYIPNDISNKAEGTQIYYTINGVKKVKTAKVENKAGAWYLLSIVIPENSAIQTVEIGCENTSSTATAYFDDFRVHPFLSSITTYVYDSKTEDLLAILDNNNFYTRFEYDAMGKLVTSYREMFSIKGEKQLAYRKYNYKH